MTAAKDDRQLQRPPTKDEIEQIRAETRKAVAETEGAEWDAIIKKADALVAGDLAVAGLAEQRAIVRAAEAVAEEQEIGVRALQRREREYLASNKFHHVYPFNSEVDDKSVGNCIHQLTEWMRVDPGCPIEVVFNSPGGSVIDGMALFDFIQMIRTKGHVVTTSTIGMAASMAGILLQAGDVRAMGRESYILIHEVSSVAMGSMGEIEDEVKFLHLMQERILNIFANRCHLTKAELRRRWKKTDWWIASDEALTLGLVDEVR